MKTLSINEAAKKLQVSQADLLFAVGRLARDKRVSIELPRNWFTEKLFEESDLTTLATLCDDAAPVMRLRGGR